MAEDPGPVHALAHGDALAKGDCPGRGVEVQRHHQRDLDDRRRRERRVGIPLVQGVAPGIEHAGARDASEPIGRLNERREHLRHGRRKYALGFAR